MNFDATMPVDGCFWAPNSGISEIHHFNWSSFLSNYEIVFYARR